jgi:hypothetical protein
MQFARNLLLTLGLCAIAACGGASIQETCEEGCDRTCDGAEPLTAEEKTACKEDCAELAERVDAADCGDEAGDLQSCSEDYVCDPAVTSECSDESRALINCFATFCADNPDDPNC